MAKRFKGIDLEKEKTLKHAIEGVKNNLHSGNKAKIYKVSKRTLLNLFKYSDINDSSEVCELMPKLGRVGHPFSLPRELEAQLAERLRLMEKWGLRLNAVEICDYVKDIVTEKKCEKSRIGVYLNKYCRFVDNRPGEEWVYYFMRRYHLSTKKTPALVYRNGMT